MKKRTLFTVMALLLAVSMLAACQPGTTQTAATTTAAAGAAATTAAGTTTAAPAATTTAAADGEAATTAAATDGADAPVYDTHLSFTVASLSDPALYPDYPLVIEAKERFNLDFEIHQLSMDTWGETLRTLAATNSLPEVIAWYDLLFAEYRAWAEQGVFMPFPDDMSRWPHLKSNMENVPVTEHLYIDGKIYASPKLNNNQPVNEFTNSMTVYRRDWAQAMGYEWEPTQVVTFEEYLQFLRDVRDKDPGGIGENLIPCDPDDSGRGWVGLARWWNGNITKYYQKEDGTYEWGARDATSLVAIKQLNEMYKEGLLYRDGYSDFLAEDRFNAGIVASQWGAMAMIELYRDVDTLKTNVAGFTEDSYGSLLVTLPDGALNHEQQNKYWASYAFSNNCSQEIMERWLDVGEWLMEDPQIEKYAYGVEGVDWSKDATGKVTVNWTDAETLTGEPKFYIRGQQDFQKMYMLEGANLWLEGNPMLRMNLQDGVYLEYFRKLAELRDQGELKLVPLNYDIDFVAAQNKDQYGTFSVPVRDAVMQAVVADNPEQVWNEFLDSVAPQVDAVLGEINAALAQ